MRYYFLFVALTSIVLTSIISLIPLWGVSQGDISDMYQTSITPAGFTFSIWSLIYLSWIALWIYLAIIHKKTWKKYFFLAGAMFLSVLWLLPWHYNMIWLSLLIMFALFWSLSYIYLHKAYKDRYFQYTLELYLWWIFVALIANIHIFLVSMNWYVLPEFFTLLSFFIWFLILFYTLKVRKSFIPSYVFLWALYGIYVAQASVSVQSWVFITATALLIFISIYHPKSYHIFR